MMCHYHVAVLFVVSKLRDSTSWSLQYLQANLNHLSPLSYSRFIAHGTLQKRDLIKYARKKRGKLWRCWERIMPGWIGLKYSIATLSYQMRMISSGSLAHQHYPLVMLLSLQRCAPGLSTHRWNIQARSLLYRSVLACIATTSL